MRFLVRWEEDRQALIEELLRSAHHSRTFSHLQAHFASQHQRRPSIGRQRPPYDATTARATVAGPHTPTPTALSGRRRALWAASVAEAGCEQRLLHAIARHQPAPTLARSGFCESLHESSPFHSARSKGSGLITRRHTKAVAHSWSSAVHEWDGSRLAPSGRIRQHAVEYSGSREECRQ